MGLSLRRFMRRFGKDKVEGTAPDGTSWASIVCLTRPEVWHRAPIRAPQEILLDIPEDKEMYVFVYREKKTYQQRIYEAVVLMNSHR